MSKKFVTMYVQSTLHEKTEFCKKIKFGSAALAFHYVSGFNANLLYYSKFISYLKS